MLSFSSIRVDEIFHCWNIIEVSENVTELGETGLIRPHGLLGIFFLTY